jgi:hypothetical protein
MLPMSVSGVQWQDYNIRRQTSSERPMRGQLYPRETHCSAYDDRRDAVAIALAADAEAVMLVTREVWLRLRWQHLKG